MYMSIIGFRSKILLILQFLFTDCLEKSYIYIEKRVDRGYKFIITSINKFFGSGFSWFNANIIDKKKQHLSRYKNNIWSNIK